MTRGDEWLAACWEAEADALLRQYPNCLSVVHVPEPWEILERGIPPFTKHEANPDDWEDPEYCLARTVQRPWPPASAAMVLQLVAAQRIRDYRGRADTLQGRDAAIRAKVLVAATVPVVSGAMGPIRPWKVRPR